MTTPSFLTVIVEIEPLLLRVLEQNMTEEEVFGAFSQLMLFCRAYSLFCRDNRLMILGYTSLGVHFLYPKIEGNASPDFIPSLPELQDVVFEGLRDVLEQWRGHFGQHGGKSLLSMALSQALATSNRLQMQLGVQARVLSIHFNRNPSQYNQNYNSVMNCIFSAQKMKIIIDALVMSTFDSNLMQQACYLSKGLYMKTGYLQDFLTLLLTHYLADNMTRPHLLLPRPTTVDFKASCFDDNSAPKALAFMCSVCLTLLSASPEASCPVCETPIQPKEPTAT